MPFASVRARARALAVSLAAAALGTTVLGACTPAPSGPKVISGTVKGADGNYVDVMLGFDVVDALGNKIDMGLLRQTGYSTIMRLNHCLSPSGSPTPVVCASNNKASTYDWSLTVPANAAKVYVEVYPKAPTLTDWVNNYNGFTGPAAGDTNESTYGMAFRRAVPVPASNVSIVLPKVCGTPGATTGTLTGRVYGLPAGASGPIAAWSIEADQPTLGMNIGTVNPDGTYRIDNLQSGQHYGVQGSVAGHWINTVDWYHLTHDDSFIAYPCQVKTFDLHF